MAGVCERAFTIAILFLLLGSWENAWLFLTFFFYFALEAQETLIRGLGIFSLWDINENRIGMDREDRRMVKKDGQMDAT